MKGPVFAVAAGALLAAGCEMTTYDSDPYIDDRRTRGPVHCLDAWREVVYQAQEECRRGDREVDFVNPRRGYIYEPSGYRGSRSPARLDPWERQAEQAERRREYEQNRRRAQNINTAQQLGRQAINQLDPEVRPIANILLQYGAQAYRLDDSILFDTSALPDAQHEELGQELRTFATNSGADIVIGLQNANLSGQTLELLKQD